MELSILIWRVSINQKFGGWWLGLSDCQERNPTTAHLTTTFNALLFYCLELILRFDQPLQFFSIYTHLPLLVS